MKKKGRIKYFYAKALMGDDKFDEVEKILKDKFVIDDLQEGEISLYHLWYDYCSKMIEKNGETVEGSRKSYIREKYPTPSWLNYNMNID